MTRLIAALTLLAALAACGVDGPPTRPTKTETPKDGISISGSGRAGLEATL